MVPVVDIALQPGAVQARRDAAVCPEGPAHGEFVRADRVERFDAHAGEAAAHDGVDLDPVRSRDRVCIVVGQRILVRPAAAVVLHAQRRQAAFVEHLAAAEMGVRNRDVFGIG